MLRLIRGRLGGKTDRDMLVVLTGQFGRLVIGLASSALLARGLGPEGLRIFAVIGVGISLLAAVGDLGLSTSAVRFVAQDAARAPERAQRFAESFSFLKIAAGLLAFCGAVLFADLLADKLLLPPETGRLLVTLGAFGVLARAFSGIVSTILQALRRFSALVTSQWMDTIFTLLGFGLLLGIGRLNIPSALIMGFTSITIAAVIGLAFVPAEWRTHLIPRRRVRADELHELWRFGRWIWVASLLSTALVQIDLLFVNRWGLVAQAGFYALAVNLYQKANILLQTAHVVLLPEASAILHKAQIRPFLRHGFIRSAGLALIVALTIPLAEPFIIFIYGEVFLPAAGVYSVLALVVILDLLAQPVRLLLFTVNAPTIILTDRLLRLGGLVLGSYLLIPVAGLYGAAFAKLLSDLVALCIVGFFIPGRLQENWEKPPIEGLAD